MLADGHPLGDVYGTVTANLTVPWSPSGVPPGASLCDTYVLSYPLAFLALSRFPKSVDALSQCN